MARAQEHECQKNQDRKHFARKAKYLAVWQIRQLKRGALIVRVPDEFLKIKKIIQKGKVQEAAERYEKFLMKYKSRYRHFLKDFDFCHFYFMYAKDTRRLLNGERKGLFLDSSLCVNDTIIMRENFFMLAEEDVVYTSSLGFVKEECALKVHEAGLPGLNADWVLKNKYGHQVKDPFPMYVRNPFAKKNYLDKRVSSLKLQLCDTVADLKNITINFSGAEFRDDYQAELIRELNRKLHDFFRKTEKTEIISEEIKDYLY